MTAIHQFLAEEETAFTPGEQEWDYLYSKDAGRAFYLIGEKGRDGYDLLCGGVERRDGCMNIFTRSGDVANPKLLRGSGKSPMVYSR